MPVKKKILLFLLVAMIIPIITLSLYTYTSYTQLLSNQKEYAQNFTTLQVTTNLDAIFKMQRDRVINIYKNQDAQKFIKGRYEKFSDSYKQFENLIENNLGSDVHSIYVVNKNNYTYGHNVNYLSTDIDYTALPEYKKVIENGGNVTFISTRVTPYLAQNKNVADIDVPSSWLYSIAIVLKDYSSMNEIGFLMMQFDEKYLYTLYANSVPWKDSESFIVDEQGYIVSHKNKELIGTQSSIVIPDNDEVMGSFTTRSAGKKKLVIYNTCEVNGWRLVNSIPVTTMWTGGNKILLFSILFIIISIMISLYLGVEFSRSITRPIGHLTKAMKKMKEGNLDVRVDNNRHDEIGLLTKNFNKMANQISTLLNTVYHTKIMKKEAEYKALQAQINPHFLYNTLDTINWMALRHKVPKISEVATALGDLMRNSISTGSSCCTLRDEIDYVKKYMVIQQIRYSSRMRMIMNIDDEALHAMIPKLIIQPLIENAIIHGIEKKVGKGLLILTVKRQKNAIGIWITDTGKGIPGELLENINNQIQIPMTDQKENFIKTFLDKNTIHNGKIEKKSHVGIINVNNRIKYQFGDEYGVTIISKENKYTQIKLTIPNNQ